MPKIILGQDEQVLAQPPEKTSSAGAAAALLGCRAGSYCGGSNGPLGKVQRQED
ncbi:MAG: hypothetical protein ABSF38_04190 [Verrucomicrobiota bacterium]|jgi:hypothetical protein